MISAHELNPPRLYANVRRHYPGHKIIIIEVCGAILVTALILQVALLIVNGLNRSRPILGLKLNHSTIGLVSEKSLNVSVAATIATQERKKILLDARGYKLKVSSRQLGIAYDPKKIKSELLQYGRSGSLLQQVLAQDAALLQRRQVSLGYKTLNPKITGDILSAIDRHSEKAPVDAYFEFNNQSVSIHPQRSGYAVDRVAATRILQSVESGETKPIHVPFKTVLPNTSSANLVPLQTGVQAIVARPLTVTAGGSQIVLSREDLFSMIKIEAPSTPPKGTNTLLIIPAKISFDNQKLNSRIDNLLQQAQVQAKPKIISGIRVIDPGQTGLVSEGDHPKVELVASLLKRQNGIASIDKVELPLKKIDPPIVNVALQTGIAKGIAPTFTSGNGSTVYLTFDDGPGLYTDGILDVLKRYGVHATFYLVGRNSQAYPASVRRIKTEGHRVANHSYSHSDLSRLGTDQVAKEISATQSILTSLAGSAPAAFRPPYGAQNNIVRNIAASLGLSDDLWSVDPRDWAQPGSSVIKQRVLAGLAPSSVILLHILHQQTVDALPSIIEGIRSRGYILQ